MICPKCGADVTGGADSCPACGEPIPDPSIDSKFASAAAPTIPRAVYAGFWLRLLAYLLDSALLGLVLGMTILWPILENNHVGPTPHDMLAFYNSGSRQATAFQLLLELLGWLYFATFESSKWQATPGQKMLNLKVTNLAGERIGFGRATGRHFAMILSVLSFGIGFVMMAFTEKKQALHDMISGCLVIRRTQ